MGCCVVGGFLVPADVEDVVGPETHECFSFYVLKVFTQCRVRLLVCVVCVLCRLSVNDVLMEMLIACYGCKTAAARRIIGDPSIHKDLLSLSLCPLIHTTP